MPFDLKNTTPTYQRVVSMAFKEYLSIFMKLFLDNFNVFNNQNTHFQKCHKFDICLNLDKRMFLVYFGIMGRQAIESKKNFGNCQCATTKNSKGHISFQQNGSILPMFHSKLCIHHGTHYQIIAENRNLWMDKGVSIGLGCNLTMVCGCTILITPKWDLDFHVHTDASILAVIVMLT
jgi:hypothetical protein